MVSADEFGRSLRGTTGLVSRRADALSLFGTDRAALLRALSAIGLTLPALVVTLALERRSLGLPVVGPGALLDDAVLAAAVATGHVAAFLVPLAALLWVVRGTPSASRFVPWAVVTTWISVCGSFALALPGALYLMNLESAEFTALLTCAFTALVLQAQFFATRLTFGVGPGVAGGIVLLGLLADLGLGSLVRGLVG